MANQTALSTSFGWESILDGESRRRLESVNFPEYLMKQRWFAGKSHRIRSTRIIDWTPFNAPHSALAWVEVELDDSAPEIYFVPLGMAAGEHAQELQQTAPHGVIASVGGPGMPVLLHDGILDDQTCLEMLSFIEKRRELPTHHGHIRGIRGEAFQNVRGPDGQPLRVRRGSAEQSNTSILFGDRLILKTFRHQESGLNPDAEIGRYLTEKADFHRIPPFAGYIEYEPSTHADHATVAMLQGLVANQGDGWQWTLKELARYFDKCAPLPFPEDARAELGDSSPPDVHPVPPLARAYLGKYLESAAMLGRRTAELHMALASRMDDPAFAPEPLTVEDFQWNLVDAHRQAARTFLTLNKRLHDLPKEAAELAAAVVSRRLRILEHFEELNLSSVHAWRIRIHGDYHLGQVLKVIGDFVILDFEGEPARPLCDRRAKQSPLKDVAGMLRSFSYAAYMSMFNYTARRPEIMPRLEPWARLWEQSVSAEFLRAYRETAQQSEFLRFTSGDFHKLLDVFLIDKALYEVLYELNARPNWVRIPLLGVTSLFPEGRGRPASAT